MTVRGVARLRAALARPTVKPAGTLGDEPEADEAVAGQDRCHLADPGLELDLLPWHLLGDGTVDSPVDGTQQHLQLAGIQVLLCLARVVHAHLLKVWV